MKTICVLLICAASLVTYASARQVNCHQHCSKPPSRSVKITQSFEDCMKRCERWGIGRITPVLRIPVRRLDMLKRAVAEELIDPEDFSVNGHVANGGKWGVGFEYKFKDDNEDEEESWEGVDPEDLSIHGNVANGGKWNLGFEYQIKDDSAEEEDWEEVDPEELSAYGNVGNGGNWNVGLRYSKVW